MNTQDRNASPKYFVKTIDEVKLRNLISILLNNKFIILIITIIFALGSVLISKYIITPKYTTIFTIVANVPSAYNTRYGEFTSPISSNLDYINLIKSNEVIEQTITDMGYNLGEFTVESISNRIIIEEVDTNQNVFPITITGNDPHEIVELSNNLYENYTNHVDLLVNDRAINHFINHFTVSLDSHKNSLQSDLDMLKRYEELLEDISPVVDQEAILETISDDSEYIVLSEIVNPNYMQLETNIASTKETIEVVENKIQLYEIYLKELTAEMTRLEDHYSEASQGGFESDIVIISDMFMLSDPIIPSDKSSPNITLNGLIGAIVGAILSIILVYFTSYIRKQL